jgi:hypothetical protein
MTLDIPVLLISLTVPAVHLLAYAPAAYDAHMVFELDTRVSVD